MGKKFYVYFWLKPGFMLLLGNWVASSEVPIICVEKIPLKRLGTRECPSQGLL